jgi:hypothetical protein
MSRLLARCRVGKEPFDLAKNVLDRLHLLLLLLLLVHGDALPQDGALPADGPPPGLGRTALGAAIVGQVNVHGEGRGAQRQPVQIVHLPLEKEPKLNKANM